MLRAIVVCAAALACFGVTALAQPGGDKKADPAKAKTPEKAGEPAKEVPKAKTPLDQMRLPTNTIIVVVDDLLKAASLIPKQWVVSYDDWLAMQDRIKSLEKQLKGERVLPSSCKLVGELKEDFLVFSADYVFATGQAKAMVPLGLKEGFLTKGALIDKVPAIIDVDKDEGYVARVEKEGNPHHLTLNFRVPVKKAPTGGLERSIDLELPPAAALLLDLTLPEKVKELRWNGYAEKPRSPGRWQIALDRSKALKLTWKEPAAPSANAPLVKVEQQIKVEVDATHVNITTDVFLEDIRPKTEEWHFYLPPQAKIELGKTPPGATAELKERGPYTVLHVPPTSERWQVTVSQRVPRPNLGVRLPVGPILVQGAHTPLGGTLQVYGPSFLHGAINIKMPGEASLGQRIVYTRFGKINQTKNTETEAAFQFVAPPGSDKQAFKAPLELEWRFEKNQLRTDVKHDVKLRTMRQGYEVDVVTQIRVTALFATVGTLDVRLPPSGWRGAGLIGTASPGLAFPGSLPWAGMAATFHLPWVQVNPDGFPVTDKAGNPIKFVPQDAFGRTRVLWTGGSGKQAILELKSSYRVPSTSRHVRLDLPRPLDTQDRDAKLTIQADERIELLHGPEGAEEPVPDRDHFDLSWEHAPNSVELAWRPYQREIVSQSTIDVELHEHSARVQQTLRFPRDRSLGTADARAKQVKLIAPRGIDKVTVQGGWEVKSHDRIGETLILTPAADVGDLFELILQYDLAVENRNLAITPIWPAHGSQEDVKVRVWTPAGVEVRLTPEVRQRAVWKERSIELVREKEQFPSLVLTAFGANLPLSLQIDDSASASLATFLADRALIQARVMDDGGQHIQARYWIRKINAPFVDIELPLALSRFREAPTFMLGNHPLTQWKKVDATEKVLRVQLHPELATLPAVLEIAYTIPAEALERSNAWSTTILAPTIRSEVVIAQMRWELTTLTPAIAASLGRDVRPETQWELQGWLWAPESAEIDREAWLLTGKDTVLPTPGVTFAFAHISVQPETVYLVPRQWWLLGCSGIFLVLTLGVYFSPLPRWAFWMVLAALALGLAMLVLYFPAAWAGVGFGLQPGLLLFLVFAGIHWVMQERYRRQLVFMPGFTRPKSGSTITRTSAAKRPREASTVDAPLGAIDSPSTTSPGPPSSK